MRLKRIAIVHDWLVTYAGAERVLERLLSIYPDADLFTICDFLPPDERGFLAGRVPLTSFIQGLPFARKNYRVYLPLMPLAIEQFDLSDYEIILSSSYAVAKGILTGPDQLHISYVHSPIRYAWDLQHQYLHESGYSHGIKGFFVKWLLHKIRIWDLRTANGVDIFIANSKFISRRIKKVYRRNSYIIYPPVDISAFTLHENKEDFYLTASRMVPYKKIDLIVDAFNLLPNKTLFIIGDGPDMEKIRSRAGANIKILGYQSFEVLKDYMQRAKAFVFAAVEDFGITPVEAQACGTPVIAFGKGGALETVLSPDQSTQPTGMFFQEQTVECLLEAINTFETLSKNFKPIFCRNNAIKFSPDSFTLQISELVEAEYLKLQNERAS